MLFCSQAYLVFLAGVFTLYWIIPWQRVRVWLLLAASFYFYACWNHWLACLIGLSTLVDYWLARGMDSAGSDRVRKSLLTISILANLSLLAYFKYVNFFLESLETSLRAIGMDTSIPLLSVIVPIGISFYTFEAINYVMDVYRHKVRAERNLANLMLFITFFPHLVAGPIVRARDFLPQTHRPKHWDWARINLGVQYFLMGLVKKVVIAYRMAALVDPVFANPAAYRTGALWMAVFAYALQIYGDFSGYSDMAIGSAHLFGYKLAQNFNMPYLASSIAEFWQRWHMSLGSWLRDYLYIPLGGSRGSRARTCLNLLITMTACGLWHGATWTFTLYGVVQGLLMSGHRLFRDFARARPRLDRCLNSRIGIMICVLLTFITTCSAFILVRAPSLPQAGLVCRCLVVPAGGTLSAPVHITGLVFAYALLAAGHWVASQAWYPRLWYRAPAALAGCAYGMAVTLTMVLAPANGKVFIYFQF